jgi:adenylyltransferase/sulfurtransferase
MPPAEPAIEIDCQSLKGRLDAGENLLLVDCREPDEYNLVHIPQATLLPMSQMQARASELEPYRNQPIVVHCHHGGRSMRVVQWLRQQGFSGAQSLAGGIDRWAEEIDRSLPRY